MLDMGSLFGPCALTFCVFMVAAGANAQTPPTHDVAAFCRMHPTVDHPEKTFFGAHYKANLLPKPVEDTGATNWRCMDGDVFVCMDSASGDWCSKKDPSRKPDSDIDAFCADHPGLDFVSTYAEAYSASTWKCNGARPVIDQTWDLDKQAYMRKMWLRLVIEHGVAVAPHADDFGTR